MTVSAPTLDGGEFTAVHRHVEFMNPWHDEIGRFAPKGTGTQSGGTSYERRAVGEADDRFLNNVLGEGPGSYSRDVEIPRSIEDGDVVNAAMGLYNSVNREDAPFQVQEALHRLIRVSKDANPDLVERLIKPASRAIADGDMETAHQLISEADHEVFTTFTEEFEVAAPERLTNISKTADGKGWQTVTPEGRTITFNGGSHNVGIDQIALILSSATTASRAGNVDADINIQIQGSWDRDTMSWNTHTMGFVVANPDNPGASQHRTVNLTPELINGNFDPGGKTARVDETLTASAPHVSQLRMTVLHEIGHVGLFEEALMRRGGADGDGKEWFKEQMIEIANTTPLTEKPLMSVYATENTVEMHAEAFAEWTNTGGNTNNPWVLRMANQFGWNRPAQVEEQPLAAAGAPPIVPWVPIFPYPEEPVALIDGPEHPTYIYGDAALEQGTIVASGAEFANPWHDEIGRFAPKGSGTRFDAKTAAQEVINGNPITVEEADLPDIVLEFADAHDSVDLTLVTVAGSDIFHTMRENGRSRIEMPQIPRAHRPGFVNHLEDLGVELVNERIDPRLLKATQSELDGRKTGQILRDIRRGKYDIERSALYVSSDNYILDGHHRWAAAAIESMSRPEHLTIPIVRVDLPMHLLLDVADEFNDMVGIPREHVDDPGRYPFGPEKEPIAAAGPPSEELLPMHSDADDGITAEDLKDLPHGDGSTFETPAEESDMTATIVAAGNPWHDDIGRFAPKGTGKRVGFDADTASAQFDDDLATMKANSDAMNEAYKIHFERGGESESTFAQARDEYLAYGSSEMDRSLRANGDQDIKDPAHRRALTKAVVMDEAIARSGVVFAEDTVLLRGVRNTADRNLTAGTTFTDPAFISVTASPGEAAQASGQQVRPAGSPPEPNPGTIVALKVPKGTKAMPGSENEKEWVLPRGGTFTVTNVIEGPGYRIAEVEVTFPEAPPVTPGIPTINEMIERTAGQQERRGLAAAGAPTNLVYERLSWDFGDFAPGAMTARHFLLFASPSFEFANPWHDEIGRFAPKGSGSTSGGEGEVYDAETLLAGERVALADVGVPMGTPEQIKLTTDTRDDDALWETAEPRKVSSRDRFVATEESVKTKPVRSVVLEGEEFRVGYPLRMYELPDGSYLVADGHHRIVMHKLLNTPSFDALVLPYPGGEEKMSVQYQWGVNQFANPWHDEAGKFAPKGVGSKSDGAAPEAPAGGVPVVTEIPEQADLKGMGIKPGGNRTTGADTKALADEVINGGDVTVAAIDADDVIRNMADADQDVVDLTGVTVEGAPNMFSKMREKGKARTEMPQITPDVQDDWFNTLRQEGIGFEPQDIDPAELSATQSELNGKKVGGMIRSMEDGSMSLEGDALLVSSDGHILDGHHRWAAAAAMSADCGGCIKIPVVVIDMPIEKLVTYGLAWTDARGIPRAGVGTPSKKAAAGMSPLFFNIKGVSFAAKKNLYTGTNPYPEGQNPKFATDAEDGLTDADFVGLPHGDGTYWDKPAADAPTTEGEDGAVTASGTRRQFGLVTGEFANPWHDEIGRFAPKGSGTKSGGVPVVTDIPSESKLSGGKFSVEVKFDDKGEIVISEEAMALAEPIRKAAEAHEREVSERLLAIVGDRDPAQYDEPPPPQLYGWKFKLKELPKIAEKIEREVYESQRRNKDMTREEAALEIRDGLRFTVHFTPDEFGPRTQEIIDKLAEENPEGNVKNTWPPGSKNPYRGVNVNVTLEDGYTYEVQFHTPESQRIKDEQHDLYKEARVLPDDDPRKIELDRQMDDLSKGMDPPNGAYEVLTPERWRKALTASLRRGLTNLKRQWRMT